MKARECLDFWSNEFDNYRIVEILKRPFEERWTYWSNAFYENSESKQIRHKLFRKNNFSSSISRLHLWFSDAELESIVTEQLCPYNFLHYFVGAISNTIIKSRLISKIPSVQDKKLVLSSLSEDEVYNYLMNQTSHEYELESYAFTNIFTSDDYRVRYILNSRINGYKPSIYLSSFLENEENIFVVIRFILSENDFEECSHEITYLLSNFKSDESKKCAIRNFGHLANDNINDILRGLGDDTFLEEIYLSASSDLYKLRIIKAMTSDYKIKHLDDFTSSVDLLEIAASCKSDSSVLEIINRLLDDEDKLFAAKKLKDDESKKKVLEQLDSINNKVLLVADMSLDRNKIEYMSTARLTKDEIKTITVSLKDQSLRHAIIDRTFPIKNKEIYSPNFKLSHHLYDAGKDSLPSDMTFGTEIEAVGYMAEVIRAYDKYMLDSWNVKNDGSLYKGVEISSKVLHFEEDDLNQIYNVCMMCRNNNLFTDQSCGGHIHFGSDYLDTIDSWFWLYFLYCSCEKIFYLISNEPGELPREGIISTAIPVSDVASKFLESKGLNFKDKADFISKFQSKFPSHYAGLNISNIGEIRDTIEFRIPNGTINPDAIVQNILLFGNLLRTAKKISMLPPTKETRDLIYALNGDTQTEEERFELLMKLLFREEENREVFRDRYLENSKLYENNQSLNLDKNCKRIALKNESIVI